MKLNPTKSTSNEKKPSSTLLAMAAEIWKKALAILRTARVQRRVRVLQIVERLAVGNKQSVVLIRVDKQEYVVGCCGDSMVLLGSRKSGLEKVGRRKAESITAQITNRVQVLSEPKLEKTQRQKVELQSAQTSSQTFLLPEPQPAKRQSRKVKHSKALPPTKSQLLKSFAGRIQ